MNIKAIKILLAATLVTSISGCGSGSSATPVSTTKATLSTGRITAFGSVFVNGVEFQTTGATVTVNGQKGLTQRDLSVGQVVNVVGTSDSNGKGTASEIDFDAEIEGPITSIDTANNRFVALGQTVIVDAATVFSGVSALADLTVNDFVEVSGARDASQAIRATYVEKASTAGTLQVQGTIASLDTTAKTFLLGTQSVNYAIATLEPATLVLANGLHVEAKGSLSGTVFTATRVQLDEEMHGQNGENEELEGLITTVDSSTQFKVDGTVVVTSAATRYKDGTASDIIVNRRVEIEGTVDSTGRVLADVVSFDSKPFIEATGDVQAVNTTAGTLNVLGTTFATTDTTSYRKDDDQTGTFSLADIRTGDHLEIGASVENGVLVAKVIERKSPSTKVEIQADVTSTDAANHIVVLHGVRVNTTAATFEGKDEATITEAMFFSEVKVGDVVKAVGSFDGTQVNATQVVLESQSSRD